jgi:hypothetical protein
LNSAVRKSRRDLKCAGDPAPVCRAEFCPRAKCSCPREKYTRAAVALVPLRCVRRRPRFDVGATLRQALLQVLDCKSLGGMNELENSEDRRSAGRHGNQHVRLRIAQVDVKTICPARTAVCCIEPRQASSFFAATQSSQTIVAALTLPSHRKSEDRRRHRRSWRDRRLRPCLRPIPCRPSKPQANRSAKWR